MLEPTIVATGEHWTKITALGRASKKKLLVMEFLLKYRSVGNPAQKNIVAICEHCGRAIFPIGHSQFVQATKTFPFFTPTYVPSVPF